LTADVTLVWRFRVFRGLVMKKLECRKAGTGATWPDSFLLAESSEPQDLSIAKAPRPCRGFAARMGIHLCRLARP